MFVSSNIMPEVTVVLISGVKTCVDGDKCNKETTQEAKRKITACILLNAIRKEKL